MRKFHAIPLLGLVLLALTACAQQAAPVPATVTPVDEPAVVAAPTAVVENAVDECVVCHTDKDTLINTSAPLADAEGESKGVG